MLQNTQVHFLPKCSKTGFGFSLTASVLEVLSKTFKRGEKKIDTFDVNLLWQVWGGKGEGINRMAERSTDDCIWIGLFPAPDYGLREGIFLWLLLLAATNVCISRLKYSRKIGFVWFCFHFFLSYWRWGSKETAPWENQLWGEAREDVGDGTGPRGERHQYSAIGKWNHPHPWQSKSRTAVQLCLLGGPARPGAPSRSLSCKFKYRKFLIAQTI